MNLIVLAIPVFVLLILLEIAWDRRVYSVPDAISNLGCGVFDQVWGIAAAAGFVALYDWLYRNHAVVSLDAAPAWLPWVLAFVGADLIYYWWHRLSHEVNGLWAGHIVHHQSEEYNLTVALRQGWVTKVSAGLFYLPLALLGVPTAPFVAMKSVMILYQFWIHTRLVGRLGPLEAVLNTPSHHRVHHGINPRYIDRNYAGTFIVWDRLFGTFEAESEPVVYGTVKPTAAWDPVWAQINPWREIARQSWEGVGLREKLMPWIARPGWRPARLGGPHVPPPVAVETFRKYGRPLAPRAAAYASAQVATLLALAAYFLFNREAMPNGQAWFVVLWITWGFVNLAGLSEGRRWARAMELARWATMAAGVMGKMAG